MPSGVEQKHVSNISRRAFLLRSAAVGGGLLLEVVLPNRGSAEAEQTPAAGDHGPEVTAWILVHPDDTITIRVARVEMGQGSFTGLPMLVAEELACDWSKVRAEYASTSEHLRRGRVFRTMQTGGSRSIRDSQEYLRQAGAAASDHAHYGRRPPVGRAAGRMCGRQGCDQPPANPTPAEFRGGGGLRRPRSRFPQIHRSKILPTGNFSASLRLDSIFRTR